MVACIGNSINAWESGNRERDAHSGSSRNVMLGEGHVEILANQGYIAECWARYIGTEGISARALTFAGDVVVDPSGTQ